MTGHPLAAICRTLRISRSTAYRTSAERARFYERAEDRGRTGARGDPHDHAPQGQLRLPKGDGAGEPSLSAALQPEADPARDAHARVSQIPRKVRRRTGRAHTGRIATEQSNVRWCSDALEIACWNGEIVQVGFALVPVTTPARSPQSNGMSEAFVNTLRRDYIESAELWSAAQVIAQLPEWLEDYNEQAPHSALGMKPPRQRKGDAPGPSLPISGACGSCTPAALRTIPVRAGKRPERVLAWPGAVSVIA